MTIDQSSLAGGQAQVELPRLTADLPGIQGFSKQQAADFQVDEIPAYPPEGQGDFLFVRIEKTGLSGEQLVSQLARCLKIAHQDVGMAGLKDRHAVTRQWVSLPARCEPLLNEIAHPGIRILELGRHRHKLRTGHLRGNRFSILIRDCVSGALPLAQRIAERLTSTGCPNFFGDQRFGRDNETWELGMALLRGDTTPGRIPRARRKFLLRLALSAVQSHLFNQALAARMTEGLLHTVLPGDVMQVKASGGPFVAEEVTREQERFNQREIVVTGPMFGPKMKRPSDVAALREAAILESSGLAPAAFEKFANLTPGTRRPYLVWMDELRVTEEPEGIRLELTLPSGSYATVVLREFQKLDPGSS
ncbi:MAG: tRNA pseudouridine(13) synthase TruD [Planctomycetales bacterium]